MVKGLEVFAKHFKGYEKHYIIIGGVACAIHEEINFQKPRATKDIDLILVIEELNPEFGRHFWRFITEGGYQSKSRVENKRELYRFNKPTDRMYPAQIELFVRDLGFHRYAPQLPITPIHIDDDISSLSAILMNTDYYHFTLLHSETVKQIHIAAKEALICLKARAYNDLSTRKELGETVDSKNINKHRNDIFRLAVMFIETDRFLMPKTIYEDWLVFLDNVSRNLPSIDIYKSAGVPGVTPQEVLHLLQKITSSH